MNSSLDFMELNFKWIPIPNWIRRNKTETDLDYITLKWFSEKNLWRLVVQPMDGGKQAAGSGLAKTTFFRFHCTSSFELAIFIRVNRTGKRNDEEALWGKNWTCLTVLGSCIFIDFILLYVFVTSFTDWEEDLGFYLRNQKT